MVNQTIYNMAASVNKTRTGSSSALMHMCNHQEKKVTKFEHGLFLQNISLDEMRHTKHTI